MRVPFFGKKKPEQLVSPAILSRLGKGASHTPDLWRLRMKQGHLLFVADETMRDCRCNSLVHTPKQEPIACYTNRDFTMFKSKKGHMAFPVILAMDSAQVVGVFKRVSFAPVRGELYKVTTEQLVELDKWKENGVAFRRERTYLDIPYREVHEERNIVVDQHTKKTTESVYHTHTEWQHHRTQDAWTYVGVTEYFQWDSTLTVVRPTIPQDHNLKQYFYYRDEPI